MLSFSEDGVSPVVGILLLVCLTVVMVAVCGAMFGGLMKTEMDTRSIEEIERKFFWGNKEPDLLNEEPNPYPIETIKTQYGSSYPLQIKVRNLGNDAILWKTCTLILYVNGDPQDLGPVRLGTKSMFVSVSGGTGSINDEWGSNQYLVIDINKEIHSGDTVAVEIYQGNMCAGKYEGITR